MKILNSQLDVRLSKRLYWQLYRQLNSHSQLDKQLYNPLNQLYTRFRRPLEVQLQIELNENT